MKPILFAAGTTSFTTNGLGRLADAISCIVIEERNGQYELEMQYPVDGIHFSDIKEERIIYAPHDDTKTCQPFDIYKITTPLNGIATIYAHHISYRLSKYTAMPFYAATINEALLYLNSYSAVTCPFTFTSDKTTVGAFKVTVPSSIRSLLGGTEGSLLDVYNGGEYEWDKFDVKLWAARGTATDATIRYGKNLTDLEKEVSTESVWTGIVPYWQRDSTVVTLTEKVIYPSNSASASYSMLVPVDFSSEFDDEPTQAQLRAAATAYANANAQTDIPTTITISFVQLWQTEEYANVAVLQRLKLCDTVSVYHENIDINVTAKIVAVEYDVLLERYNSMTLGEPKANFASTIKGISDSQNALSKKITAEMTTAMQNAVKEGTELITGGLGGYVVLNTDANGKPEEILIMDTADTSTAVDVIRINKNGIGFSTSGYNGPFTTAWTIDGKFYANRVTVLNLDASVVTTGTMLADRILGGTLKLGGASNGNGVLEIYDSNDTLIGQMDQDGAALTGNITMKNGDVLSSIGDIVVPDVSSTASSSPSITWLNRRGLKVEYDTSSSYENFYAVVPKNTGNGKLAEYAVSTDYYIKNILVNFSGSGNAVLYKATFKDTGMSIGHAVGGYGSFQIDSSSIRCYVESQGSHSSTPYLEIVDTTNSIDITIASKGISGSTYIKIGSTGIIQIYSGNSTYIDMSGTEMMFYKSSTNYIRSRSTSLVWNGITIASSSSSSKRYKHDIKPMQDAEFDPHRLLKLQAVQFVYNDEHPLQYADMKGQTLPGFIAEEVAKIYPSAVIHHPETGEIESWDERRIIPGMLYLIQEQEERIKTLEDKTAELEAKLREVLKLVDA